MGLLVFVTMSSSFIVPFFLQLVKGYSTQQMGLLMMAMPTLMGVFAPLSGSLSDRFGSRGISLAGIFVIALGCLAMSTLNAEVGAVGFALRIIPIGIGFGLFQSPNNSAIMGAVSRGRLGIASGLLSLSRTLGQTTGLPLVGAIFTARVLTAGKLPQGTDVTTAPHSALVAGIADTYRLAAWVILGAACLAVFAFWYDRKKLVERLPAEASPD